MPNESIGSFSSSFEDFIIIGAHRAFSPKPTENKSIIHIPASLDSEKSNRLERHTLGRASCVLRSILYTGEALAQAGKIILKAPTALIATAYSWKTHAPISDSLSIDGFAKDSVMLLKSMDKIGQAVLGIIFGQSKYCCSFEESLLSSVDTVLCGSYHSNYENSQELFSDLLKTRPSYFQLIFDAYSSYKRTW
ncbi:hypothetical protein [Simkania negevensis]|uniref:Uncharacterized protein n=1 Tax=Simkania negevensis (strain ATCC VR-1471 / DSM 27360 / Z) TaxID=331113 RepID=F8L7I2_SIMNZ|nr:hypothetical protein [Simkania negevensis]CCB88715.1 unknown protein [Simkania negevensis Z]